MKTALHIIEQLSDFGGTARKLLYLAESNQGSRIVFATYLPSSMRETFEASGVEVHNFNTLSLLTLVWKTIRLAKEIRASVICTHFTRPMVAGFIASRLTGLPVIHFEHSPNFRTGRARWLGRLCLPFAKKIICNSRYTADSIANTYQVDASALHVVYNPVDARPCALTRSAARELFNLHPDTIAIGHVGGLVDWRDQVTLLKAFHLIHKEYPQARLLLIGNGPERERLQTLSTQLGLENEISFLGYRNDIGDFLQALDIYVNPAIAEGFGIAVAEAMRAALPVVLARAGAHPELVDETRDGLLYDPGSPEDLAATLRTLTASPALRARLGQQARDNAARRFSKAQYTAQYAEIIDTIPAKPAQPEPRAS